MTYPSEFGDEFEQFLNGQANDDLSGAATPTPGRSTKLKKDIEDQPLNGAFNPNAYDWPKHLKRALEDLKVKKVRIDRVWRYYDGDHPKVWMTDVIKDKLDDLLTANMAENWCAPAVDAHVKRQAVDGFTSTTKSGDGEDAISNDAAQNVWKDNNLHLAQKDIYKDARICGEAFLFVWKDDDKESGIDITQVDARRVWWPDDSHRADPVRVVQIWADDEDGIWRATCLYKYVVVRLIGPKLKDGGSTYMPQARYFEPDPADPGGEHGFDRVPVVRFARERRRRSIIDLIRSTQDKINKLAANLLVSAEFNAWRKMLLLTEQDIDDETLKMRPNRVGVIHPGGSGGPDSTAPTSVWEGSATELANYSDEQDKLVDKLFSMATLPGHMKVQSTREVPSGAAYEADEGPFTEDVADANDAYGASWHDLMELAIGADVECQWRNPHIKSDKEEMETIKLAKDAGVPLSLALKFYAGWDVEMLKELENAPLSPQEQLAVAATQALAEGGDPNAPGATGSPKSQPPITPKRPTGGPAPKKPIVRPTA